MMTLNKHGLPVLHRRRRPAGELSPSMNSRQERLDKVNKYYDDLIAIQRISNNMTRERAKIAFNKQYNINNEGTN